MRCQVNLSDEMVKRVDVYANKMGVSRSALCSMLIGQGIMNYDNSSAILDKIGTTLGSNLTDETFAELGKVL